MRGTTAVTLQYVGRAPGGRSCLTATLCIDPEGPSPDGPESQPSHRSATSIAIQSGNAAHIRPVSTPSLKLQGRTIRALSGW